MSYFKILRIFGFLLLYTYYNFLSINNFSELVVLFTLFKKIARINLFDI